jgi:hypothetical protein
MAALNIATSNSTGDFQIAAMIASMVGRHWHAELHDKTRLLKTKTWA